MPKNPAMDEDRAEKVSEIKDRVEKGAYSIDPSKVADAILRRPSDLALLGVASR
jgi:anti-sigma28 factor (negative regulator of flagellin synthesis)